MDGGVAMNSSGLIFAIATILLIRFFITYFKDSIRAAWGALFLKGPFPWPIVGNAAYALNINNWMNHVKRYGEISALWMPLAPVVIITNPNDIKKVLSNPKNNEKWKIVMKVMQSFFGDGLSTQDVSQWKIHRKLLQPVFHRSKLEDHFVHMQNGTIEMIKKFFAILGSDEKKALNTTSILNEIVFRITADSVLGVPLESEESHTFQEESPYRKSGAPSLIMSGFLQPWKLLTLILNASPEDKKQQNDLKEFTKKMIIQRKSQDIDKPQCFMDWMLQINRDNPDQFSEEDCVNQAITLMLAGQDSTATTMACALHCLANNPEVQKKAYDELDGIFGGSDRLADIEDLKRMVYLDQCIKEIMRLFPALPLVFRTLGEDTKLGGRMICKGSIIAIVPYITHRLPEIYPDPEKFDPERFKPQENLKRLPYSYLPFASGLRNCIGYQFAETEMKLMLSAILRKFSLSPVAGKEQLSVRFFATLRASGGCWVTVSPRNKLQSPVAAH